MTCLSKCSNESESKVRVKIERDRDVKAERDFVHTVCGAW